MNAIQFFQHGGLEVLVPTDLPDPEPGPDDAVIEV